MPETGSRGAGKALLIPRGFEATHPVCSPANPWWHGPLCTSRQYLESHEFFDYTAAVGSSCRDQTGLRSNKPNNLAAADTNRTNRKGLKMNILVIFAIQFTKESRWGCRPKVRAISLSSGTRVYRILTFNPAVSCSFSIFFWIFCTTEDLIDIGKQTFKQSPVIYLSHYYSHTPSSTSLPTTL